MFGLYLTTVSFDFYHSLQCYENGLKQYAHVSLNPDIKDGQKMLKIGSDHTVTVAHLPNCNWDDLSQNCQADFSPTKGYNSNILIIISSDKQQE